MESKWNVPLGRWVGVPVFLHWSWVLIFVAILVMSPKFALVYAGLFFLVLLHECGHCLAAHYYQMPVHDIVLLPIGGAARMEISIKPVEEMVMALAGPAVNVALVPIFYVLGPYHEFLATLGYYNLALLVFNLVPAFPMDGGRVLRSVLSHFMKDHVKATVIAGRVGQFVAGGFFFIGLISRQWFLAFIGAFVWFAAEQEIRLAPTRTSRLGRLRNSLRDVSDIQRRLDDLDSRYRDS